MPRSADALVEPQMLIWAREAAHLDTASAARRAGVPEERIQAWERGEELPTVKQLRKLAHIYAQSFAAFYLPAPPKDRLPKLTDYRRLPGGTPRELSYEVLLELRAAVDRRGVVLELLRLAGVEPPTFELDATLDEDPEAVGGRMRERLGVVLKDQMRWRDNRLAFNAWREAAEGTGILVFQARGIEAEVMRGFSISERPMPVVVVNRKDAYAGRIFSLVHEIVHISLHASGVCDLTATQRRPEEQRLEVFCNHAAGAAIVPVEGLLQDEDVARSDKRREWPDEKIEQLAVQFSTSREVILRRLLIMGRTTQPFYELKRQQYVEEIKAQASRKGFVSPSDDAVSVAGKPFVRLVLDAFHEDRITASDVADYLGVRLKHLPALGDRVGA